MPGLRCQVLCMDLSPPQSDPRICHDAAEFRSCRVSSQHKSYYRPGVTHLPSDDLALEKLNLGFEMW